VSANPEQARLASEALARAKADAWARGDRPSAAPRRAASDTERTIPVAHSASTGIASRPRRDDPQPLTATVGALLSARGWRQRAAVGAVFGRWAEVVGPDLAAHTRPEAFLEDGELVIAADSAAWAVQVRLLAPELLRRLATEVGAGTVCRVRVQGPSGGAGRSGQRRHVRLSPPQDSVTAAKIEGSHRANARGGPVTTCRRDGAQFVVRCSVDHGT
jgi:predicted nucleic acid-binding Zn ribbon protein